MATDNVKDIDLTDALDLKIANGDFVVSDSDQNHILLIIKSYLGAFKQFPLVGVGIDYFRSSNGQQSAIKRSISVQLEYDSYSNIETIVNKDNTFYITAKRKK